MNPNLSPLFSAASAARELNRRGVSISARTIVNACQQGRVPGATLETLGERQSRWVIPGDSLPQISLLRRGRKPSRSEKA